METFNLIDLHRTRDFSRKMNATFEFIRQNFKSLGKSLIVIAGPPILVAGFMMGTFFSSLITAISSTTAMNEEFMNSFGTVSFVIQMTIMVVFFVLSSVMSLSTINNYMQLYGEKKTNNIEVREVWERVSATFWMYLGTVLLFIALMIILGIAVVAFLMVLLEGSPALSGFLMFIFFLVFFYLLIGSCLTFMIRTFEQRGFFDALGRSFYLIYGKWWSTFGLIFVLQIVMTIISYIFLIPGYAFGIVSTLHSTSTDVQISENGGYLIAAFYAVYYTIQLLLSALPNIGIAFQYFNLVELKEAKGLLNKIDTFGKPQEPLSAPEEQY